MNWVKSRVKESNVKKKQREFFANQRKMVADRHTVVRKPSNQPAAGRSFDLYTPLKVNPPSKGLEGVHDDLLIGVTAHHRVVHLDLDKFASTNRISTADLGPVSPLKQKFLPSVADNAHYSNHVGVQQSSQLYAGVTTQSERFELPLFLACSSWKKQPPQKVVASHNQSFPANNSSTSTQNIDMETDVEPVNELEKMFGTSKKSSPKVTFDDVTNKWLYGSASSSHSSASSSDQKSLNQSDSRMSCDSYEDPKTKLNTWYKPLKGSQPMTRQLQEKFVAETPDVFLSPHDHSSSQDDRSSRDNNDFFKTGSRQYTGQSTAVHHRHRARGVSCHDVSDVRKELLVDDEPVTSQSLTSFKRSNLHRCSTLNDSDFATKIMSSGQPLVSSQSPLYNNRASPAGANDNRSTKDHGGKFCTSPVDEVFTSFENQFTDNEISQCDRTSTNKCQLRSASYHGGFKESDSSKDLNRSQSNCFSEQTSDCSYQAMNRSALIRDSSKIIKSALCQKPTQNVRKHGLGVKQSCNIGQTDSSGKRGSSLRDSCNDGKHRGIVERSTRESPSYWQRGWTGERSSSTRGPCNIGQPGLSGECSTRDSRSDGKRKWIGEHSSCTLDSCNFEQRGLTGKQNSSALEYCNIEQPGLSDKHNSSNRNIGKRIVTGEQSSSTFESPINWQCDSTWDHNISNRNIGKRIVTGEQSSSTFESPINWQRDSTCDHNSSAHDSRNIKQFTPTGKQSSFSRKLCNVGLSGLSGAPSCVSPNNPDTWQGKLTDEQGCSAQFESRNISQHQLLGKHGSCIPGAQSIRQTGDIQQSMTTTHNDGKLANKVLQFSMVPFHVYKNDSPGEPSCSGSLIVSGTDRPTPSVPKILERSVQQPVVNNQQQSSFTSSKWLAFINGSQNKDFANKKIAEDHPACVGDNWQNEASTSMSNSTKQNIVNLSLEVGDFERFEEPDEEYDEDPIRFNTLISTTARKSTPMVSTVAVLPNTPSGLLRTSSMLTPVTPPLQTASYTYRISPGISPYLMPTRPGKTWNYDHKQGTSTETAVLRDISNGQMYSTSITALSTTPSTDSSKDGSRSFSGDTELAIVNACDTVSGNTSGALSQTIEQEDIKLVRRELMNSHDTAISVNNPTVTVCQDASLGHRLSIKTCDRQTSPVVGWFTKDASTSPIHHLWLKDASTSPIRHLWLESVEKPNSFIDDSQEYEELQPQSSSSRQHHFEATSDMATSSSYGDIWAPVDALEHVVKLFTNCPMNSAPSLVHHEHVSTSVSASVVIATSHQADPLQDREIISDQLENNEHSVNEILPLAPTDVAPRAVENIEKPADLQHMCDEPGSKLGSLEYCNMDEFGKAVIADNVDSTADIQKYNTLCYHVDGAESVAEYKESNEESTKEMQSNKMLFEKQLSSVEEYRHGNGCTPAEEFFEKPNHLLSNFEDRESNLDSLEPSYPFQYTVYELDYGKKSRADLLDQAVISTNKSEKLDTMMGKVSSAEAEAHLFDSVSRSDCSLQAETYANQFNYDSPSATNLTDSGKCSRGSTVDSMCNWQSKLDVRERRPLTSSETHGQNMTNDGLLTDQAEDELNREIPQLNSSNGSNDNGGHTKACIIN